MKIDKKLKIYGKSKDGNYRVIDTVGVPHPYCITPKHLEYSEGVYLDIPGAEAKGAVCGTCKRIKNKDYNKPILTHEQHEQALLVECLKDPKKDKKELHQYLLSIKEKAEADNYAGFSFLRKF